MTGSKI